MKRLGIYAGSFNPFHNGHYNIYSKARNLFDEVLIAVGINPDKDTASQQQISVNDICDRIPHVLVENFTCMLHELIIEKEQACDVTLVRGLRNGYDLDYEMNQYRFLQEFKFDIKVVYIPCDKEFEHISSTALRGMQNFCSIENFLPKRIK